MKGTLANSADPDQTPQNAASDQGLHCMHYIQKYAVPVAQWIGELTLNQSGFSPLWFEPRLGHMWESQVLLTDGQVVFTRVLRFSPTPYERSARYK